MVRFIGYDEESKTLRIQFDKSVYEYFIVPEDVARQADVMLAGEDYGWIRKYLVGIYPSRRVV